MSARTTDKHANSGGLDVSFTQTNGNVKGLTKGSFISFIDINDGINFEIIDKENKEEQSAVES